MWKNIRPYIRDAYRLWNAFRGFIYDLTRFVKYGGWKGRLTDVQYRNYNAAMVYHGLEKSLSYKSRNPNSGWRNASELSTILEEAKKSENIGYHDRAAKVVLEKFIGIPENTNADLAVSIEKSLKEIGFESNEVHGAIEHSKHDFLEGVLKDPEKFFFSRYSLREFRAEAVSDTVIKRALKMALKTPSVCNRQPWAVYHTADQAVKETALSFQSGNKPFGANIPNLLIVATDLKAFFAGNEHYQHWIDGGLFSMSIMYALHSIGVGSCALNWSQDPKIDKKIRKKLNISPSHTIIMMIAAGYPDDVNMVCASSRKPLEDVYWNLEKLK